MWAQRHVANFIEKQSSSMRQLEEAGTVRIGTGEGAAYVTEKQAFRQLLWHHRTIHRQEGAVGATATKVQGAGDQFLAGAALARDQHGYCRLLHSSHSVEGSLQRRALTNEVPVAATPLTRGEPVPLGERQDTGDLVRQFLLLAHKLLLRFRQLSLQVTDADVSGNAQSQFRVDERPGDAVGSSH